MRLFPQAPKSTVRILAMLRSQSDRETLHRVAGLQGWEVSGDPLSGSFAVAIYDRDLPGPDWRLMIGPLSKFSRCVLLASASLGDSLWQEVVEHSGYDLVPKPLEEGSLVRCIEQAIRYLTTTSHGGAKK